jgi:Ca-activated chloride channel homolog
MYEQNAPSMFTTEQAEVALQSVSVDVIFHDVLCETTMSQVYRNMEKNSIEAIYTFPLATTSVLLYLQVVIGDKKLKGKVVGKSEAEEKYEDAITDGDSAVMLELISPGMYTMNIGNIIAGEEVSVSIIYAELLSWQGDTLRFFLPTTIAPRYGSAEAAGLQPHQIPEVEMLAENRFQLRLTMLGTLVNADIASPSHQLAMSRSQNKMIITIATGEAFMDRDFILNMIIDSTKKDSVLIDQDRIEGQFHFVALASFAPYLPVVDDAAPRSIKIVVDCSGSMSGDSITQARQAINDILKQLRPEDYFNLIAFGSTHSVLFVRQVLATKENITKTRRFLRGLDADMGGTEIEPALKTAIHLSGPAIPQDILLITDGEVWDDGKITSMVAKSGHRIFTVGVGSAVSENFVRQLALKTGGACELVTPGENMAEKIVRHFKRIYLPRAEQVTIHWPLSAKKVIPQDLGPIYDGDTLHAFAWFDEKPIGSVTLEMTLADGRTFSQTATIQDFVSLPDQDNVLANTLARMAMQETLNSADEATAAALAVQYQLVSPYTNYLVVAEQADNNKTGGLPELRKVSQMLAAGWGGSSSVKMTSELSISYSMSSNYLEAPCFLRKSSRPLPIRVDLSKRQDSPAIFIRHCNDLYDKFPQTVSLITSFNDLQDCGLSERVLSVLRMIAGPHDTGASEKMIVPAFMCMLIWSGLGEKLNRNATRAIKKAIKVLQPDKKMVTLLKSAFKGISEDCWGSYVENRAGNPEEN